MCARKRSCVCVCARVYACMRACNSINKHTHTHTHTHTRTHTHTHTRTCIHTHTRIHTHSHMHTYTHRRIHTHSHMHTHTHRHIDTYTASPNRHDVRVPVIGGVAGHVSINRRFNQLHEHPEYPCTQSMCVWAGGFVFCIVFVFVFERVLVCQTSARG